MLVLVLRLALGLALRRLSNRGLIIGKCTVEHGWRLVVYYDLVSMGILRLYSVLRPGSV